MKMILFSLVALGTMSFAPGVHAVTWRDYFEDTDMAGNSAGLVAADTYTMSTNKDSYAPGENLILYGSISNTGLRSTENHVVTSNLFGTLYNNSFGELGTVYFSYNATAPSSPGSYTIEFTGCHLMNIIVPYWDEGSGAMKTYQESQNACGSSGVPFTVTAPATPPTWTPYCTAYNDANPLQEWEYSNETPASYRHVAADDWKCKWTAIACDTSCGASYPQSYKCASTTPGCGAHAPTTCTRTACAACTPTYTYSCSPVNTKDCTLTANCGQPNPRTAACLGLNSCTGNTDSLPLTECTNHLGAAACTFTSTTCPSCATKPRFIEVAP